MAKENHTINLLSTKKQGLLGEFLAWLLTIGRILIILTEFVALGVFGYRFYLDMQIADIHAQIQQESATIVSLKPSEDLYRSIQNRLTFAKQYDTLSGRASGVFYDILNMGIGLITFKNLYVQTDLIRLQVQAPASANLAAFVTKLKTYPKITGVTIDTVENKTTNGLITLTISASVKQPATQQVPTAQISQPVPQP